MSNININNIVCKIKNCFELLSHYNTICIQKKRGRSSRPPERTSPYTIPINIKLNLNAF